MVTLTLHDKDALAVLSMINVCRGFGAKEMGPNLDRVAAQIKCALLLCECDNAQVREDAQ